jgi:hypothetical protein
MAIFVHPFRARFLVPRPVPSRGTPLFNPFNPRVPGQNPAHDED